MKSSYHPKVFCAWCKSHGIPAPEFEYRFHNERKWRFDIAWPNNERIVENQKGEPIAVVTFHKETSFGGLAVEVDGGIWIRGGHNRGAQMKKDWEKANTAQSMNWKILRCEPKDLMSKQMADWIKVCLVV